MTHHKRFTLSILVIFLLSACGTGQPNSLALTATVTQPPAPTPSPLPSSTPIPQPTLTPFPVNAELMEDALVLTSKDLNLIEPVAELWPAQQAVNGVAFSAQTGQMVLGAENKIILWDIRTNSAQQVIDLGEDADHLHILAVSPDGKQIAYIGDKHFMLTSLDGANVRQGSSDDTDKSYTNLVATFSPDGRLLAIVNSVGDVLLWDVQANHKVALFSSGMLDVQGTLLPACIIQVKGVAFSPDGKTIFSACDRALIAWDVETQKKRPDFRFWSGTGNVFILSLDGKLIINGEDDGKIDIWELSGINAQAERIGHDTAVNTLVLSPDGSLLTSASQDGTVILWDTQSWSRLATLEASAGFIAFSPDGKFLVTGASRRGGTLWGVRSASLTVNRTGASVVLSEGGAYLGSWKKLIPESWLAAKGSFPRHEIRITSGWVEQKTCNYGENGIYRIQRRQSTITVEIADLESNAIIATKVFTGELPTDCPESYSFSATNLTVFRDGPAPDIAPFESWLKEVMAKLGYD